MKLEIEAKIRVKNLDAIAKKLRQMGSKFLHTVQEQDLYFNSADGKLLKSNCALRLRKRKFKISKFKKKQARSVSDGIKSQIFLTFKGPTGKSAFKSRREDQVEVDDFDMTKNILLGLGYKELLTVRKIRQIWHVGKCEVCLDKVRLLGTFIEVEGPSEKAISTVLDKLGLDKTKHISTGYARMTAQKLK
jgi:predicted adenylyl cyclase CyaB